MFISSDEEEESEAEADSEEEEEEQNSSNQKESDPSIVCLSSDDDEDDDIKKDDKYDQKDPVEVPKHLQEYMKEELQTLEAKKRTMEVFALFKTFILCIFLLESGPKKSEPIGWWSQIEGDIEEFKGSNWVEEESRGQQTGG